MPATDGPLPDIRQTRASVLSIASILPAEYAEILLDTHSHHYRQVLKSVVYLGVCFSIVFTSNIVQSFLTSLYPKVGFISLALTQFFAAIGSFIAPVVGHKMGVKSTMVLGSFTYSLLMAVVNLKTDWLLMVMSALNGIGAALLWISQGIWLTRITQTSGSIGTFTGIFFTLFNMSGIFGNVIVIVLQQTKFPLETIIWILTTAAFIGSLTMCFCAQVHDDHHHHHHHSMNSPSSTTTTASHLPPLTLSERFYGIYQTSKSKQTLLLIPYILCQGLSLSYSAGNLPVYANNDEQLIVFMLLAFGLAATITSFVCGRIFDRFGMFPLLVIHIIVVLTQYSSLVMFVSTLGLPKWFSLRGRVPHWMTPATLIYLGATFGLLDFLINTIINVSISHYYDKHRMPATFSLYRFISCIGFAASSAISPVVPDMIIVIVNIVFCILSIVCYMGFLRSVSEEVRMSITSGRASRHLSRSYQPLFGHDRTHEDATRFSVASVACIGPARPSVLSIADVIAETVDVTPDSYEGIE